MQNYQDSNEYIRGWFSLAFRGLQIYDWMICVRKQSADTSPSKSCCFLRGLDQWVGSGKTAELIEMPFE